MKRTYILAVTLLVALFAATSCQKEEDLGRILTASIEQFEADSKAYVNTQNYACWENGDVVRINNNNYTINVESGDNPQSATITPNPPSGALLACYPASIVSNLSASGGTITLRQTQIYEETSVNGVTYQKIHNPMAAFCPAEGSELKFRNLCALLKVTLPQTPGAVVKYIAVGGRPGQNLFGTAQLKLDADNKPYLSDFSNGGDIIALTNIHADLSSRDRSFYIVVPSLSVFNKMTITVILQKSDGKTYRITESNDVFNHVVERNHIGAFNYDLVGDEQTGKFLYYTTTDGKKITLSNNSYVVAHECGFIMFNEETTTIANNAFDGCTTLASFTLPDGLTSIGEYAFNRCSSLASFTLPSSLDTIGSQAFYECTGLASVTLPEGLTSIKIGAFQYCSSLASVTLPSSLTSIGFGAFSDCSSLSVVDVLRYGGTPVITQGGPDMFFDCSNLQHIYVPNGSVDTYKEATYWSDYADMISVRPSSK